MIIHIFKLSMMQIRTIVHFSNINFLNNASNYLLINVCKRANDIEKKSLSHTTFNILQK